MDKRAQRLFKPPLIRNFNETRWNDFFLSKREKNKVKKVLIKQYPGKY